MKETIRRTMRRNGQHDPMTAEEIARILITFQNRAEAVGWIEDRSHPENYELVTELQESSIGMDAYKHYAYHVVKSDSVPTHPSRQCDPEKQYEYKYLERVPVQSGELPLDNVLTKYGAEGWRVRKVAVQTRPNYLNREVWQFLLERRVRDVVQFVDPVKQKQVVNPQLISFSEAVCRMYDGQWFQSPDNVDTSYGLINGKLVKHVKNDLIQMVSYFQETEITLDLVTARWYQVQKPVT